jgi:hypothetical protein
MIITNLNSDLQILSVFLAKTYFPKKNKAITAKEVLKELNNKLDGFNERFRTTFKSPIKETQFREMINFIRSNNLVKDGELLAGSNGYYISNDKDEVIRHIESLEGRISSMKNAIEGMRKNVSKYVRVKKKMTYDKKPLDGDLFDNL